MSKRLALKGYRRRKEELQIFVSLVQVKREVVSVLNWASRHEGMWRSGCVAPRILNLGIRWRLYIWVIQSVGIPTGLFGSLLKSTSEIGLTVYILHFQF